MIESDGDLHGALVSFLEVARVGAGSDAAPYQSLHIEECVEVMMQRCKHSEPLEIQSSSKRSSTSADEQATKRSKHVWYQRMCVYLYTCLCIAICVSTMVMVLFVNTPNSYN